MNNGAVGRDTSSYWASSVSNRVLALPECGNVTHGTLPSPHLASRSLGHVEDNGYKVEAPNPRVGPMYSAPGYDGLHNSVAAQHVGSVHTGDASSDKLPVFFYSASLSSAHATELAGGMGDAKKTLSRIGKSFKTRSLGGSATAKEKNRVESSQAVLQQPEPESGQSTQVQLESHAQQSVAKKAGVPRAIRKAVGHKATRLFGYIPAKRRITELVHVPMESPIEPPMSEKLNELLEPFFKGDKKQEKVNELWTLAHNVRHNDFDDGSVQQQIIRMLQCAYGTHWGDSEHAAKLLQCVCEIHSNVTSYSQHEKLALAMAKEASIFEIRRVGSISENYSKLSLVRNFAILPSAIGADKTFCKTMQNGALCVYIVTKDRKTFAHDGTGITVEILKCEDNFTISSKQELQSPIIENQDNSIVMTSTFGFIDVENPQGLTTHLYRPVRFRVIYDDETSDIVNANEMDSPTRENMETFTVTVPNEATRLNKRAKWFEIRADRDVPFGEEPIVKYFRVVKQFRQSKIECRFTFDGSIVVVVEASDDDISSDNKVTIEVTSDKRKVEITKWQRGVRNLTVTGTSQDSGTIELRDFETYVDVRQPQEQNAMLPRRRGVVFCLRRAENSYPNSSDAFVHLLPPLVQGADDDFNDPTEPRKKQRGPPFLKLSFPTSDTLRQPILEYFSIDPILATDEVHCQLASNGSIVITLEAPIASIDTTENGGGISVTVLRTRCRYAVRTEHVDATTPVILGNEFTLLDIGSVVVIEPLDIDDVSNVRSVFFCLKSDNRKGRKRSLSSLYTSFGRRRNLFAVLLLLLLLCCSVALALYFYCFRDTGI